MRKAKYTVPTLYSVIYFACILLVSRMLIIFPVPYSAGLVSNDEIGYIVPPSDFLLNEELPYIEKTMDYKGENHYKETNSIGPECAIVIAEAFQTALEALE